MSRCDLKNVIRSSSVVSTRILLFENWVFHHEKQILKLADNFIVFRTRGDACGTLTAGAGNHHEIR
jgi:hypothetical protein